MQTTFTFSNRVYDILKKLVQVILPAVSALYFGLSSIWGWSNAEQVVGTIAVITTFLGVSLGISSTGYEASGKAYAGGLLLTERPDGSKLYTLELDGDPAELQDKESVTFKVHRETNLDEGDLA